MMESTMRPLHWLSSFEIRTTRCLETLQKVRIYLTPYAPHRVQRCWHVFSIECFHSTCLDGSCNRRESQSIHVGAKGSRNSSSSASRPKNVYGMRAARIGVPHPVVPANPNGSRKQKSVCGSMQRQSLDKGTGHTLPALAGNLVTRQRGKPLIQPDVHGFAKLAFCEHRADLCSSHA